MSQVLSTLHLVDEYFRQVKSSNYKTASISVKMSDNQ